MPEPLLSLRGLRVSYGGIQAVKGIDLEVAAGELVALIGANGAGKTTTLKAITGLSEQDDDDDGAGAASVRVITGVQLMRLQGIVSQCSEAVIEKFGKDWPDPSQIPADQFDGIVSSLERAAARHKQRMADGIGGEHADNP